MLRAKFARQFGVIHNIFGLFDTKSTGYILGTYPPNRPIPEHEPIYKKDEVSKLQLTTLNNGVRIVTESTAFPSVVRMGVKVLAGTRDEENYTSGVCHALYQTYLKTNERTNEQINYGMIQMSGGSFAMNYNQEELSWQGQCLAHDAYDFMQMMSDCVLDEKTVMDEEAAQWRIDEYWKLYDINKTNKKRINDLYLTTGFGLRGYGMPLRGFQSNFQNIGSYMLNNFRKAVVTPDRILVWGSGVNNHDEFVHSITPYFQYLDKVRPKDRLPNPWLGGETREIDESNETHISLSFQAPGRNDPDVAAAYVLKSLIGTKQEVRNNRANTHFFKKHPYLSYVEPTYNAFSEVGVFRVDVGTPTAKAAEASDALVNELNDLKNVTEEEVNRAKVYLKTKTLAALEEAYKRVNFKLSVFSSRGQLHSNHELVSLIDKVDAQTVRKLADKVLKSHPALVVLGGDNHAVPSVDKFASRLK